MKVPKSVADAARALIEAKQVMTLHEEALRSAAWAVGEAEDRYFATWSHDVGEDEGAGSLFLDGKLLQVRRWKDGERTARGERIVLIEADTVEGE